jgi:hypothetical protein
MDSRRESPDQIVNHSRRTQTGTDLKLRTKIWSAVAERSGDTAFECRRHPESGVAFHFPPQSKIGDSTLAALSESVPPVIEVFPKKNQAAQRSGLSESGGSRKFTSTWPAPP